MFQTPAQYVYDIVWYVSILVTRCHTKTVWPMDTIQDWYYWQDAK